MGKVAITLKVYPESMEAQEQVKAEIMAAIKPTQLIEVPIFGGLNAFKVIIIRDDKEGAGNVEEEIGKIKGVSEVQTDDVTLIS